MKRIDFVVPECFWGLDNTFVQLCTCNKIYFDVLIDFKEYRLIICKDWYVMKVKSLQADIETEIRTDKYVWRLRYYERDIKSTQAVIIDYLIEKYFKTPVLDSLIHNMQGYYRGWHTSEILTTIICERPFIFRRLDIFKFIEYYVFEYNSDRSIPFEERYNSNIEDLFRECKKILNQLLKSKLKATKYLKLHRLINKIAEDPQENALELMSNILLELSKVHLKENL